VGPLAREPGVQPLGPARRDEPLSLLARGRGRNRIAIDARALVLIGPLAVRAGIGSGDQDLVAAPAQAATEPGDVDLAAAEALGEVPAHGLHDLHRFMPGPRSAAAPHRAPPGRRAPTVATSERAGPRSPATPPPPRRGRGAWAPGSAPRARPPAASSSGRRAA